MRISARRVGLKMAMILSTVLFSGCAGYINGDLDESNLDKEINFVISQREYYDNTADRYKEADFRCGNKHYKVLYTFEIQEDSLSTNIMTYATGLTLGLLPLYSTHNVDFSMSVYYQDRLLVTEQVDARAHFVFGWLPVWWHERKPSTNQMKCSEGEGISGCLYRAAYERSLFRLHRILREKGLISELCEG